MWRRPKPRKEEKPKPVEWSYSGNVIEIEPGKIEFLNRAKYFTGSKSGGVYQGKPALKIAGKNTFETYAEFEASITQVISELEQTIEGELHMEDVADKLMADPEDRYRVEYTN